MATIQRNVKTFGTRSFVGEVAAAPTNLAPILSNEVDADLDTVYAAWNGGADSVNIKDLSVTTAKLADFAVTGVKIAAGAVGAPQLFDPAVTTSKIVDGAVTTPKLADAPNGVTTAKISDLHVTTGKLADEAVSTAKLALGAPVNNVNQVAGPISAVHNNVSGTESGPLVACAVTVRGGTVLVHNHVSWYVASTTAGSVIVIMRVKRDGVEVASRRYDVVMPANASASLAGFSFVDTGAAAGARTYTVTITCFGPTGATVKSSDNFPGFLNLCALG